MIEEHNFLKWSWMANWCKDNGISPYKSENWRNAEKAYNDKFNSKSELKLLEEKYGSGDYICVAKWEHKSKLWYEQLVDNPFLNNNLDNATEIKLIHKKHKDILDAYLADNSVEIEFEDMDGAWKPDYEFIKEYNEQYEYKLKQQYPIFKRNKDGEVFRFDTIEGDGGYGQWVLHKNLAVLGVSVGTTPNSPVFETIPYDKERGLYHLQPVWCWDNGNFKSIGFYKEGNLVIDTETGNSSWYLNIEPVTSEQLKTMQFVWEMYKQVLKDIK